MNPFGPMETLDCMESLGPKEPLGPMMSMVSEEPSDPKEPLGPTKPFGL